MFEEMFKTIEFVGEVGELSTVGKIVNGAASVFVVIAFGLSIVSLTVAFVQYTTSMGDPKNIEKAHKSFLWAGIGAFVSLLAFVIKTVLLKYVGVGGMY
jgi:hypothetical protein